MNGKLMVKTSRYWYEGDGRLDITAKTKDPIGRLLSPTWPLVLRYKRKTISESQYKRRYLEMVKARFEDNPKAVKELFGMGEVVIVCFCPDGEFCHRFLAAEFLESMGAKYKGEVKVAPSKKKAEGFGFTKRD